MRAYRIIQSGYDLEKPWINYDCIAGIATSYQMAEKLIMEAEDRMAINPMIEYTRWKRAFRIEEIELDELTKNYDRLIIRNERDLFNENLF